MDDGNRFKALAEHLATFLQVQEVIARDLRNTPSHVFLARCKKILVEETKNPLLLEREIHLSRYVNENWESNSSEFFDENFELFGSVLKKVTLIEKKIDENLEGAPIDSNSEGNVVHNSFDEDFMVDFRSKRAATHELLEGIIIMFEVILNSMGNTFIC
ncbi:uncharacterized protein LOC113305792 [Papaver somniferum]|uniref:uncharacterized protein LOC113305792 n=1 Tax=Papaver somniferum TaxID=3469 RepID=UPI000E6F6E94|nr:uncharacterized protein LOC113305792 [Papaver somniferum]